MSYQFIQENIEDGNILLLDGGTGSEIERQGVAMNDQSWCGVAHMEQPDIVRKVHASYIEATIWAWVMK